MDLWGKKGPDGSVHLLEYHLIDAAVVCGEILRHDSKSLRLIADDLGIGEEECLELMSYLTAVHDIGKASSLFQDESIRSTYRHDRIGYVFLMTAGKDEFTRAVTGSDRNGTDRHLEDLVKWLSHAATMHHGRCKITDDPTERTEDVLPTDADRHAAVTILSRMGSIFMESGGKLGSSRGLSPRSKSVTNIIAGLVSMSDWIASDETIFGWTSGRMDLLDYRRRTESRAREIFDSDILGIGRMLPGCGSFQEVFGMAPTQVQSLLSEPEAGPQLVILEDATGSGKTEAALSWALGKLALGSESGITIALPTRSTTNMMFERVRRTADTLLCDGRSVALVHGTARKYLESDGRSDTGGWYSESGNKPMFSNLTICTVDQALKAVIPVRYAPLRLLSLERHVLIIDEVHSYDAYTFHLICTLVRACAMFGISVIAMSATLPIGMRRRLVRSYCPEAGVSSDAYPLVTVCAGGACREIPCNIAARSRRTVFARYVSDEAALVEEMTSLASEGFAVCWIRNTVDDAISAYDKVCDDGRFETILIHSRFMLADRQDQEKRIIGKCGRDAVRERGLLVVSTQVLEQSLDISFDRVFSDLSPMDSLIQRIGRDQRFPGSVLPCEVVVHGPAIVDDPDGGWYSSYFGGAGHVYPNTYSLWRTANRVDGAEIRIPEDYRDLIEDAYAVPPEGSPFRGGYDSFVSRNEVMESGAGWIELDLEEQYGNTPIGDREEVPDTDVVTREPGHIARCILAVETPEGLVPAAGDTMSSTISLRKQVGMFEGEAFGRAWRYTKVVRMRRNGDGKMRSEDLEYDSERGARYVQSHRGEMDSRKMQIRSDPEDSPVGDYRRD
ncbi:MAG: CRISPR-associated helicase Cas3' [Thermoplasmata archaeon]|nr:CRISPR-associated helicase Cas3' [Thermoplasmata archaeon]